MAVVNENLSERGLRPREGTVVDASIVGHRIRRCIGSDGRGETKTTTKADDVGHRLQIAPKSDLP